MTTHDIDESAKIIWDYMLMHHELKPADAILALGSYTTTVAKRAAELYLAGYGKYLVLSGNSGVAHGHNQYFSKPEAEVFADVALEMGVPKEKIIIENQSTNTEDNITFVRTLLQQKNISVESLILVQKPYMERRTYATFKNFWPSMEFQVTSPQVTYEEYKEDRAKDGIDFLSAMVGDLQRIKEYPARGFQIPQEIPADVWQAYERLVALGFTRRLIK